MFSSKYVKICKIDKYKIIIINKILDTIQGFKKGTRFFVRNENLPKVQCAHGSPRTPIIDKGNSVTPDKRGS